MTAVPALVRYSRPSLTFSAHYNNRLERSWTHVLYTRHQSPAQPRRQALAMADEIKLARATTTSPSGINAGRRTESPAVSVATKSVGRALGRRLETVAPSVSF